MKRCLATFAAVLATGTSVHAQPQIGGYSRPVVNSRPAISPYLNLNNRNGANPAINYYGIVQPQIQNQQAIQQLQVQQGQMALGMNQTQGAGLLANEEIAPTGRVMGGYFNYSHFFPLYNRGTGGTVAAGSQAPISHRR